MFPPPPPSSPAWYREGLALPVDTGTVEVAGAAIRWLAWGRVSDPPLVLVHGGAAHARWWLAIAPSLARDHRVIALDLSGHGLSDHREVYDAELWAEEVLAAASAAGAVGRPVVVGHSMGGFITIVLAARHGAALEGVIVLDAPVRRPDPESEEGRIGRMFRAPKTYPSLQEATRHFHLVPPQPCDNDWLLEHVGQQSLRETPEGWTWCFDPRVFTARRGPTHPAAFSEELAQASCRTAIVNGERSQVVDEEVRAHMAALLAGSPAASAGVPVLDVPHAHHHLLLDQPLAVVTAIRGVLAAWQPIGQAPARVGLPRQP
ncbi:MAG: alpha/beta fold hydrolase [Nitriliruptoraceae bacterium]